MPLILGRDQLALKKIMTVETPAATTEGSADEPGVIQTVAAEPGLPEWSTEVPGAFAGGSIYFPQTRYNTTDDNAALGYLDVPHQPAINQATSFTIQAWAKKTGGDAHNRALWCMGAGGYHNGSSFYIWNNQAVYWNMTDGAASEFKATNSPSALTTDTWYHIVCAFDGNSGVGKMFINGTKQSSNHAISSYTVDTSGSFTIGLRDGHSTGWRDRGWVGYITEVCFWNIYLNSANVTTLYNSGDGAPATDVSGSDIVAYWRMLEGTGITVSGSNDGSEPMTATFKAIKPSDRG